MEKLKIKYLYKDLPKLLIPKNGDLGIDIMANEDIIIPYQESRLVNTGVCISPPKGWGLIAKDRSSVSKYCRVLGGVFDTTYTGIYFINLYCHTRKLEEKINETGLVWYDNTGYHIKRGHKVAQLIIVENHNLHFEEEVVDELEQTDRGDKGFGSSGR